MLWAGKKKKKKHPVVSFPFKALRICLTLSIYLISFLLESYIIPHYDREAELWSFASSAFSFSFKVPFSFLLLYFLVTVFPSWSPSDPGLHVFEPHEVLKVKCSGLVWSFSWLLPITRRQILEPHWVDSNPSLITYQLCDLGQVATPLCALGSSFVRLA